MIDNLLITIPALIVLLITVVATDDGGANDLGMVLGVSAALLTGLGIGGFNVYLLVRTGQTIGKRSMGIEVISINGERAGFVKVFLLRQFVWIVLGLVPGIGPLIGLADSLAIFGDDRRCVHDYIAGTHVVSLSLLLPDEVDAAEVERVFG